MTGDEETTNNNHMAVPNEMMTMEESEEGICITMNEDEKTIEEQVEEMMEITPIKKPPRKFSRIRTFVQKLNEEFLSTLYEADQRHKAEVQKLREEMEAQDEKNEALQHKIKTLLAQEEEQVILVKQAGEKIKKLEVENEKIKQLEAANDNEKIKQLEVQNQQAEEKIEQLESQKQQLQAQKQQMEAQKQEAEEKIEQLERSSYHGSKKSDAKKMMDLAAREEKVMKLAKKAALKIKELESREKTHVAHAKEAALNIQKLKQMLLDKQDELEALQGKAFTEFDTLSEALKATKSRCASLQTSLDETRAKYTEEHALLKMNQKKIAKLREMIEQYDGGVEATWADLSHAFSEEDPHEVEVTESLVHEKEDEEVGAEVNLEELLSNLKVNLSSSSDEREQLMRELNQIQDDGSTNTISTEEVKNVAKSLGVDVTSEALPLECWDDDQTVTSLEEQMRKFITNLDTTKKNSETDAVEEAREASAAAQQPFEEEETREDVIESKPSYEKIPTSLVKERLKMFSRHNNDDNFTKSHIGSMGNKKGSMKTWKQKATTSSRNTTPKHGNTTPKKSFNFNGKNVDDEESIKSSSSKSSSTRSVRIPKALLKKIEAGETLSAHEREILKGIQKFSNAKSSTSEEATTTLSQTSTGEGNVNPVSAE